MKQPLTDERMPSPDRQLEDCLRANIRWSRTQDPTAMWHAQVGPDMWTVRVNDFPEEHLYTVFVNAEEVGAFDDWPVQWLRTEDDPNDPGGAVSRQPGYRSIKVELPEAVYNDLVKNAQRECHALDQVLVDAVTDYLSRRDKGPSQPEGRKQPDGS